MMGCPDRFGGDDLEIIDRGHGESQEAQAVHPTLQFFIRVK